MSPAVLPGRSPPRRFAGNIPAESSPSGVLPRSRSPPRAESSDPGMSSLTSDFPECPPTPSTSSRGPSRNVLLRPRPGMSSDAVHEWDQPAPRGPTRQLRRSGAGKRRRRSALSTLALALMAGQTGAADPASLLGNPVLTSRVKNILDENGIIANGVPMQVRSVQLSPRPGLGTVLRPAADEDELPRHEEGDDGANLLLDHTRSDDPNLRRLQTSMTILNDFYTVGLDRQHLWSQAVGRGSVDTNVKLGVHRQLAAAKINKIQLRWEKATVNGQTIEHKWDTNIILEMRARFVFSGITTTDIIQGACKSGAANLPGCSIIDDETFSGDNGRTYSWCEPLGVGGPSLGPKGGGTAQTPANSRLQFGADGTPLTALTFQMAGRFKLCTSDNGSFGPYNVGLWPVPMEISGVGGGLRRLKSTFFTIENLILQSRIVPWWVWT